MIRALVSRTFTSVENSRRIPGSWLALFTMRLLESSLLSAARMGQRINNNGCYTGGRIMVELEDLWTIVLAEWKVIHGLVAVAQ